MAKKPADQNKPGPDKKTKNAKDPAEDTFTFEDVEQLEEAGEAPAPKEPGRRKPTMVQPSPELSDSSNPLFNLDSLEEAEDAAAGSSVDEVVDFAKIDEDSDVVEVGEEAVESEDEEVVDLEMKEVDEEFVLTGSQGGEGSSEDPIADALGGEPEEEAEQEEGSLLNFPIDPATERTDSSLEAVTEDEDKTIGDNESRLDGGDDVNADTVLSESLSEKESEEARSAADEEAAEEEPKSKKKVKSGSRAPAWVGGTLLGVILGGSALEGLNYFDVIPDLRGKPAAPVKPVANIPPAPAIPALTAQEHLKNGDLENAKKAGIEAAADTDPALKGQFTLDSYLASQGKAGKPINNADPLFAEAINHLKKAEGTADGLFQLGRAQEIAGQIAEARATFQKGEQKFKNDKRFRYGLLRLDTLQTEAPAPEPKENTSSRLPQTEQHLMGMLLVTLLQEPLAPQPAPGAKAAQPAQGAPQQPKTELPKAPKTDPAQAANEEEAGSSFWSALKSAKAQNFAEAIKQLDEAKKLHAQRRLTHLRKQQNPLSDPNEEIFLRSCEELKQLWTMQDQLRGGGYLNLADKRNPNQALTSVLTDLTSTRTAAAELASKLVEAKIISKPEEAAKGIETLLADRESDKAKLADLDKNLKTALKETTDTKTQLSDLKTKLDEVMKEDHDQLAKSKKETADREALLKQLQDGLAESKFIDAKADRSALVGGLKDALKVAAMKDPEGKLKELQKQVALLTEQRQNEAKMAKEELAAQAKKLEDARLKEVAQLNAQREKEQADLKQALAVRRAPGDLLPLWLPVLQENINVDQAKQAQADASMVNGDPQATPVTRAQAGVITGLALRNQDQFAQAQKPLSDALAALPPQDKTWHKAAEAAVADVADPIKYYLSRFDKLKKQGRNLAARQAIDRGIRALPESPALLNERASLLLELAPVGSEAQTDPGLDQARKDAEQAIALSKDNKQQLARAHYNAGRVSEAYGDLSDAVEHYREAIRAWPVFDREGSRMRAALARTLNQPRGGRPPLPKEKEPADPKIGRLPDTQQFLRLAADPKKANEARRLLLVLANTTLQDPGQPEQPAKPRQLPPPQQGQPKPGQPGPVPPGQPGPVPGQPGELDQPGDMSAPGQPGGFNQPGQAGQPWQLGQPQPQDREESIRIANQIIDQHERKPGSVPFDALAEAFAIKGLWSRALFIYVEGLKPHLTPEEYEGLVALLRNHPQLQRPDNLSGANPAEAENRFAQGMRAYFSCNFADAEKAFRLATESDSQDARYFYFLGLTRTMLGKPEAAEDFEQGVRLEKQNKPSLAIINASLERVQGDSRHVLTEARSKAP